MPASVAAPDVAPKAKVTKVKRQQTTSVTAPAAAPARQSKQLACLGSEQSGLDAYAATE